MEAQKSWVCMQQHHIVAQSGPEGYAAFEAEVRRIFCIEADMDMNLIFDCAEPTTGAVIMARPGVS